MESWRVGHFGQVSGIRSCVVFLWDYLGRSEAQQCTIYGVPLKLDLPIFTEKGKPVGSIVTELVLSVVSGISGI